MNSKESNCVTKINICDTFKFYESKYASKERTKQDFYDQLKSHWIKLYCRWSRNDLNYLGFFRNSLTEKQDREEITNSFRFISGSCSLPHDKKIKTGGDDYYYVNDRLLVVADGVGGWKNYNINPAEHSKELCQQINENFHQYELYLKIRGKHWKKDENTMSDSKCEGFYDIETLMSEKIVKKLLIKSANMTKSSGTSTCTILMLDRCTGQVFSSYVGDSCYLILRYAVIKARFYQYFMSEEQMHSQLFNMPYQIGKKGDDPAKSITHTHELKNNDIVILATDGLWDNLEVSRIIEIVNENYKSLHLFNPKELAGLIAEEAKRNSNNKKLKSPFSKKKAKFFFNPHVFSGGKPDDITVVVSHLTNKEKFYYDSSANTSTTDNNEKNDDLLELI